MRHFKYQITWSSFFEKPQVFVTDSEEDVKVLREEGRNLQYQVQVEEGFFNIFD